MINKLITDLREGASEYSIHWKAADTLDQLRAENTRLAAELASCIEDLSREVIIGNDYLKELAALKAELEEAKGTITAVSATAQALLAELEALRSASSEPVYVLFDGPPGPEAGRFIDVEDADGKGVKAGGWNPQGQYWRLGPFYTTHPAQSDNDVWQPIETAPKGGAQFLTVTKLSDGSFGTVGISHIAYIHFIRDGKAQGYTLCGDNPHATHWMPLPAAPIDAAMQGETK